MTALSSPGAAPARLTLSTPGDVLEALPYLLGFHPAESVVALSLRGPRFRLGLHVRLDLPPPGHEHVLVARLVDPLAADRAERAMVVVYTGAGAPTGRAAAPDAEEPAALPGREVVDAVESRLHGRGIALCEALLVSGGRWWSYRCTDPTCCPPQGRPLAPAAGSSRVAAAATYAGMVALPSREDLVATLEPVRFLARVGMEQALDRGAEALAARLASGEAREALREETRRRFEEALARFAEPPASLSDDETARLVLGLADVPLRDEVALRAVGDRGTALLDLLTYLVRRALPPADVAPATVLAMVAYQRGDGVLAGIALERALAGDPTYTLARLLDEALQRGVPPGAFREVRARTLAGRTPAGSSSGRHRGRRGRRR